MKYLALLVVLFSRFGRAAAPDPFWWGVGHASFQVEGSPADSDWRRWVQQLGNVADGSNADHATEFWRDPSKDFALAQELGAKMFRLSIAWERVEPAPDLWDDSALDRYEKMLIDLRARGIEPLVTLHHFVLPAWLAERGGITAKEFPDQFAKYALHVVHRLVAGPAHVRWWMTFNEPMVLISAGYVTGEWPPNKKDKSLAMAAIARVAKAHIIAVQAIRKDPDVPKDLQFSLANHWRDFQATGFGFLNASVAKFADLVFNRWLLGMIVKNGRSTLDYIGINYYGRSVIHPQWKPPFVAVDEGDGRTTDIGWVIYPEGLGHVLKDVDQAYHLPILVSENGIADAADKQRPEFLKQHIAEIRAAREQKIPVIGYLHWTLTDNFEWARGFGARFGLVELNPATGERKPRPSFQVYKDLIRTELATDALKASR